MNCELFKQKNNFEFLQDQTDCYSKHFKPIKKKSLKVHFKDEPEVFHPIIETQEDTIEKDEVVIMACKTLEQIDIQIDMLLEIHKDLKAKQLQGFDISFDFDCLKKKLQMIQQRKEEILTEMNQIKEKKETENSLIVHNSSINQQAVSAKFLQPKTESVEIKNSVFNYLHRFNSVKKFQILFLFHWFELDDDILALLNQKIQKYSAIRFAYGYYTDASSIFHLSQFKDSHNQQKEIKHQPFKDIMDIRSQIVNLDWEYSNIDRLKTFYDNSYDTKLEKFVFNFIYTSYIESVKSSFGHGKLENFMNFKDPIKDMLNFGGIKFQKHNLNQTRIDYQIIDKITSEIFLQKSILQIRSDFYLKNLYCLKRTLLKNMTEYQSNENKLNKYLEYKEIARYFDCFMLVQYTTFKKQNLLGKIEMTIPDSFEIKIMEQIVEPSKDLYLISASYRDRYYSGIIWLEILESDESLNRIINIHLTAEIIVKKFNSELKITFEIPAIMRILIGVKKIVACVTNQKISKSEIRNQIQEAYDAMECLTHYSYEYSNKELMLFDLRTIRLENNKFLLTEPVIFSLIPNKFASSDLGIKGIEHFKREHECNFFCKELKLKRFYE